MWEENLFLYIKNVQSVNLLPFPDSLTLEGIKDIVYYHNHKGVILSYT